MIKINHVNLTTKLYLSELYEQFQLFKQEAKDFARSFDIIDDYTLIIYD